MDYFDRFAEDIRVEKRAIYLYGAGFIADKITARLKEKDIDIDGYIVDKKYLPKDNRNRIKNGKPIISVDELDIDCILVNAIQLDKDIVSPPISEDVTHHIKKVINLDFSVYFIHGAYDETFAYENMPEFMKLYCKLCDSESRVSLMNFIAQKVSGSYFKQASDKIQYFDEDIFLPTENEIFVDCGAYDGDSLLNFFEFLKRNNVKSYKKCFAFEPDEENFRKLEKTASKYPNIAVYKLGTYSHKDTLHFSDGNDTGSSIQNSGGTVIEVDSIDNIVNGEEVTYIKMDIEGAELDTLKGARNTILKYHPKLAVCVYHKTDDLLTIPQFILGLHNDYHFYIRNYQKSGRDMVLYAI